MLFWLTPWIQRISADSAQIAYQTIVSIANVVENFDRFAIVAEILD